MSWLTTARGFVVRWGTPARFAVRHVLSAVPGGSLVADAVDKVLECVQNTAIDQEKAEARVAILLTAQELERVGEVLDECNGQLAGLMEQVVKLDGLPEQADRIIVQQRATDARIQAGFSNLARFAAQLKHIAEGVDQANAKLDSLQEEQRVFQEELRQFVKRNHVRSGVVSVTDERERAELYRLRDEYRRRPPEQQPVESTMLLADSLSAAGQFTPARELHAAAADRAVLEKNGLAAEGYFKTYLDACELHDWSAALKALLDAARLDPPRFRPFPTDEYVPEVILGAGGFGTVVKCKYLYADEENPFVAVKTLHTADLARDVTKVFAEAHTIKTLKHPAIIGVHYWNFADEAKTRPFIVMEYFDGISLADHLRQHGKLPPADTLAIARQVAAAMKEAHRLKIFHRDLKPDNILVKKTDNGWEVRLIDFGLAVRQQAVGKSMSRPPDSRSARDHSYAGTFKYAPPEQKGELDPLSGKVEPVDAYSDVYTFGKTLCEALFGTTAPKSFHYAKLPVEFQSLHALLERCTADAVQERVREFGEVIEALEAVDPASDDDGAGPKTLERVKGSRKEQTLTVLHRHHVLDTGTAIMTMPDVVTDDGQVRDQRLFRARIGNLGVKKSIIWEFDENAYSLTELSCKLEQHGLTWVRPKTFELWQVVGQTESMWDQAERHRRRDVDVSVSKVREHQPAANPSKNEETIPSTKPGVIVRQELTPREDSTRKGRKAGEVAEVCFQVKQGGFLGLGGQHIELKMQFAWCPPGTFQMGDQGDPTQHQVTLTKGFWMAITPVTQAQWQAVMGKNTSHFKGANRPIENVSWVDCQAFVKKLGGDVRLPTEAEWEYARRAGTQTEYYFGADPGRLGDYGWFAENSGEQTHDVAQKKPNAWGLFDMAGNVWEWCADWYGDYAPAPQRNPTGAPIGSYRVLRGGSWLNVAGYCAAAYRYWGTPTDAYNYLGLRLARVPVRE
jgi:formylglycine-generating enzyme required for sulfatase activity/serine/threonine protein kinase